MVVPVKSYGLTAAQIVSRLSDSKTFEWNLNATGQGQGRSGDFMPRQHVASLKFHYAIPLFKVKNMECVLAAGQRTAHFDTCQERTITS